MGLDNYWVESEDSTKVANSITFEENPPNLYGGIFSYGGAASSFRGKVYNAFVEDLTGHTLYEEFMESSQCLVIAEKLKEASASDGVDEFVKSSKNAYELSKDQYLDFIRYWIAYSEQGYHLRGWW